jgi:hypothetical protein
MELFAGTLSLYHHDLSTLMSNPIITSVIFIFCHYVYVSSESLRVFPLRTLRLNFLILMQTE